MFKKIDPKLNLPEEENKVIGFWNENNIFQKTLEKASPKGDSVFFEGPPTANGQPGIHHVEARSFKDAFCRYKTMQGYFVKRKAGWDTHGLPVELQVEKELGISGKGQIENLVEGNKTESVTKFNELCKKSVWKYKAEWEKLTKRMGYWVDMTDPYVTYEPEYIESVWNIISEINKKGLLYKGYKVVPYCPRCGTALSSHEVAQGYKNVQEESVYVKVKSTKEDAYFLVWTTTPWTLAGNAALAINRETIYCKSEIRNSKPARPAGGSETKEIFILAKNRIENVLKNIDYKIIEEFTGQDLIGKYSNGEKDYEPIYEEGLNFSEAGEKSYKLISADYVSDQDGTGIVHIAPAFGQDDYIWGFQKNGIEVLKTVDDKGTVLAGAGKGSFVKDADQEIKLDLDKRNILFRKEPIKHDYPFCWRCDSPLLYFARDSWYIAMNKLRDELLKNNEEINWNPAYLKHGRFGNWLENLEDWAISRDRYWGTPLPVWECGDCKKHEVIGSYKELREKSDSAITEITVIRHGQSECNTNKLNSNSREKWPLTEEGIEVTKNLAEKLSKDHYDLIIASPVVRTKQTAEILSKALGTEIEFNDDIAEYDFGDWNDLIWEVKSAQADYQEYDKKSPEEKFNFSYPNGESRKDVENRVKKFIENLSKEHNGKKILVVTHSGIVAMISKILLYKSLEVFYQIEREFPYDGNKNFYLSGDSVLDVHKPFIDGITLKCPCGGEMKRASEVMDVWLDSGTMPFSQYHYPFENSRTFENQFPAEFIAEAVDQTRGWFYTLLAVSTIMKGVTPYKNVISLGHVLDEKGKKMSKSLGNIVVPDEAFAKYGADVIRYYFYSVNQPGEPKLFSDKEVTSLSRNLFMTLWNVFTFFVTYASIDGFKPTGDIKSDNLLDKWIVAKFTEMNEQVTKSMNKYDAYKASNLIIDFVGELSTWYVRRSRRRFWKSENDSDKNFAYETLYYVLLNTAKLLAPFAPMFAETIYRNLKQESDPESVHMTEFPSVKLEDRKILDEMDMARKIVEAGLSRRAEAKVKVRQPLATLAYGKEKLDKGLEEIIAEEVNVKSIQYKEGLEEVELDINISNELKMEGMARELIRSIQALRKKSDFQVEDRIEVSYQTDSDEIEKMFEQHGDIISKEILAKSIENKQLDNPEGQEEFIIEGQKVLVGITRVNSL